MTHTLSTVVSGNDDGDIIPMPRRLQRCKNFAYIPICLLNGGVVVGRAMTMRMASAIHMIQVDEGQRR